MNGRFLRRLFWLLNRAFMVPAFRANPDVEVLLHGRALQGIAEEVTDPQESARAIPADGSGSWWQPPSPG